jgi:predicted nucleotidyltransferase
MAPVTDEAIKTLSTFLELVIGAGYKIQRAILFGSYANGTADRWSDIDVVLVSPNFTGIPFNDRKALIPFLLKTDSRIEVHPFKPEDFTRDNFFVVEILETGVSLI